MLHHSMTLVDLSCKTVDFIISYLNYGNSLFIKKGTFYKDLLVKYGVPQESILDSLLFNV